MGFSSIHLYFDDLEIGQEWISSGRTITEADIVNFAGFSGDFNPIHVDHEFAKTTPFRRPIAHGFAVFSIGSGLGVMTPPLRTIALLRVINWNFLLPVFAGDTIRIKSRVLEKTLRGRGRRGEVVWYRGLINQDNKIVQEGQIVLLVEARPPAQGNERRLAVPDAALISPNGTME
ncbi:MAG: MaoC/PaaZ C-terminal domain-containing protein [Thermogemmata sp.]|jgi:acyl dehydratase|nr:MaoC/PaaZ C-terminal domain-containing protein [Gemmataceae bacterium]